METSHTLVMVLGTTVLDLMHRLEAGRHISKGQRNISTERIFLSAAISLLTLPKTGVA